MPLSPGDKLGPYEIVAPIGKGGMGEVYKARDTKLNREVAIKTLPAAVAHDPERLARFEREAKVLAALNHPNIATIYAIEESPEGSAIAMELVPGNTLKGPLPLDPALKYARQIADALEAAHEKGITHRDLKPANIMITPSGSVKVLDFGLAAVAQTSRGSEGDPSQSPTLTISPTQAGMILGTAAYMSPEHASGQLVDKRADIWSFGVVLYEMLTGEQLFKGATVSHILASVLKDEPDFAKVPAEVRHLLRRCLEKDPAKRLRDVGDAMELVGAPEAYAAKRPWLHWAAVALFAATTAVLAFVHFREKPPAAPYFLRFQISAPTNSTFGDYLALSPDGRQLAFTAVGSDGHGQLWVRSLDTVEPRLLPLTQSASTRFSYTPFWSPDSRFIAFGDGGELKKVDVSGGPAQTICDVKGATVGLGSWSKEGIIVFATTGSSPGLWRVSAAGGNASLITMVDTARGEFAHTFPFFLPDGKHFLYARRSTSIERGTGVYVGSTDLEPKQQPLQRLLAIPGSNVAYAPSPGSGLGRLLFLRDITLMSQPFDANRLELTGEAVPVAEQIGVAGLAGFYTASTNGLLAYRGGAGRMRQLTWFDRQGKPIGAVGTPHLYGEMNLSPDGNRVLVYRSDPGPDLWMIELDRGTNTRFTFNSANESYPVWSPDGSRVAFSSNRNGVFDLFQKSAGGAGEEVSLFKSAESKAVSDWSRDGRFLLYIVRASSGSDLWVLPLEGERKPTPFLVTPFNETQARFSPDGHWVAYTSDESGSPEIYVRPFPASSVGKWQISTAGGQFSRWRRDGKELFYLGPDNKLMSADVSTNASFKAGIPKPVIAAPLPLTSSATTVEGYYWDVAPDGQRFLIVTAPGAQNSAPITVITNWQGLFKK